MSGDPLLSVALDVVGRECLVVGGGPVAARRAARLIDAGATVTVVAPHAVDQIRESSCRWEPRPYRPDDIEGAWLVVTATGIDEIDAAVVADATASGLLVNDAGSPDRSSVVIPAAVRRGPIEVAVHTGGQSPALARWLTRRIAADLDDGIGDLVQLLAAVRSEMIAAGRPTTHPGWEAALDAGLVDLVRSGDQDAAATLLRSSLEMAP